MTDNKWDDNERAQNALDFVSKLTLGENLAATVSAPVSSVAEEEGMYRILYCWAECPGKMNEVISYSMAMGLELRDRQLELGTRDQPIQCTVLRDPEGMPIAVVASLEPMTMEEAIKALELDAKGPEGWN